MQEKLKKQQARRKQQEEVVAILAEKYNLTTRRIQMVITDGSREDILLDYLAYKEKHDQLLLDVKHNKLLAAVAEAVPFLNN